MALWQPVVGRDLSVARILLNVRDAHRPFAAESVLEHRGIPGHTKPREVVSRSAGEREQLIRFLILVNDVVKERAKLRLREGGDRVSVDCRMVCRSSSAARTRETS